MQYQINRKIVNFFLENIDLNENNNISFNNYELDILNNVSNDYLLHGVILKILQKNQAIPLSFKNSLKENIRINKLKLMSMKRDLIDICEGLNNKKINFVILKGMALNFLGYTDSNTRFVRDIDIMINESDIDFAYDALKSMGYKYFNKDVNDSSQYRSSKHHLPVMINNRGTLVELHWRITSPRIFKECPLKKYVFKETITVPDYPKMIFPNEKFLVAHCLYHSILHHSCDVGPTYILDIYTIFKKNRFNFFNNDLIKLIYLNDEYLNIMHFIENSYQDESYDYSKLEHLVFKKNSKFIFANIFKKSEKENIAMLFSRIFINIKNIRDEYQTSIISYTFVKIILKKIINFIKKNLH